MIKFIFTFLILFAIFSVEAEQQPDNWAPDFLIVGAQKAGTTALHHFLMQHPLILKKFGEPHFFDMSFKQGVSWYKKQFPAQSEPNQLIGDRSPYYLFHPLVPARVQQLYPNVKILIVLRNPIDRAYSQYWQGVHKWKSEPLTSFEAAIDAEPKRLKGEENKFYTHPFYQSFHHRWHSYLARGVYVEQIKRWLAYFPKNQICIIPGEDLRKNPEQVMKRVFAFLGLPHHEPKKPYVATKTNYPPMNPETRKRLAAYFRPYNQELENLLGMKFNWD